MFAKYDHELEICFENQFSDTIDIYLSLSQNSGLKLFSTSSYTILNVEMLVIKHDFEDFKSIYLIF